ncbi:DegT/DnrJ/EryC1/StrS family aminotransferase [Dyadobacter sp. 32]|uniref:DegT/DnrJ/EryC1/StrS family aminotransferase n=1 Tax=Dyadobacter sp. 32 TaxID=538966 RepID=UPI0011ED17D9
MGTNDLNRRKFMGKLGAGSLAMLTATAMPSHGKHSNGNIDKLAVLGGEPIRKNKAWPQWPYVDEKMVESIVKTTRSGKWSRIDIANGSVATFEKEYAKLLGANYCVGTGSGTQALSTCVEALGIGPGDEVVTSPYTDMGTVSAIITSRALPVLAELDPDSYQLDPYDVEKKITPNTKAIIPVYIGGVPCDIDRIMAIAKKHNLKVIEDSCQAHLASYKGRKLGTIGDLGCFSFQGSKQIACGEGGAIIGNDQALMEQCYTVQNHGTARNGKHVTIGPKYRMNEFEGSILLGQLDTVQERFRIRNENADYLNAKLKDFPGLVPQKRYEGTESAGLYIYALTYHKEHFGNADRSKFLKAIQAEGIGFSGYIANGLHREPWVDHILGLRSYKQMYTANRLKQYKEDMNLPKCDLACSRMVSLWASGTLLGTKQDMDNIIDAIMKVYDNRDKLHSL